MNNLRRRIARTPLRPLLLRWRHTALEPTDIFLASFPKSGNTWLRHMLVQLLTGKEHDFLAGRDRLIPYVGRHGGKQNLRTPSGDRLLKTHETYRACYRKAIYVVRDPRDVLVSNYWFQCRQRQQDLPFDRFVSEFVRGEMNAYGSWHDHVASWRQSPLWGTERILLVRYEDLRREPVPEMRRVCRFLAIPEATAAVEAVVEANSFAAMKRREGRNPRMTSIRASTGVSFVRKGQVGQWQEALSETQLELIERSSGEQMQAIGYGCGTELAGTA